METPGTSNLLSENTTRRAKYFGHYDPLKGTGGQLERFEFKISPENSVFLPVAMKSEPFVQAVLDAGTMASLMAPVLATISLESKKKKHIHNTMREFNRLRIKYDFEYWAASCVTIPSRNGPPVKFSLNYPQRFLLAIMVGMYLAKVPIRIILLKARQWGGSTLVQLFQAWLMLFTLESHSSAIVTTVEAQARHIRGMFDRMAQHHPKDVMDVTLVPYQGTKNRSVKGRGNVIGVGSFQEPENLRTFTFQFLHLSEVASWRGTEQKKPEDLVQAIRATVPLQENTCVVLESTAKGVGNFFHKEWQAAASGTSGYGAVFVPWFWIIEYQQPIKDYASFIKDMNTRDWELWRLGATLEGIKWYNEFKRRENYNDWRMMEEYPSTAQEAFISSGQRVFRLEDTLKVRENCIEPEFIGDLKGGALSGPASLKHISFESNPKGNFKVWTMPDNSENIPNRYVLFVDLGGARAAANKSVVRVMDRYWMLDGGKPEFVATWRGNMDADLVSWKAAQIATWYNKGLLAIEENYLDKESDGSGNFLTVLDEIADYYENLFARTDPDKVREGVPLKYGFHTNKKTKPMLINRLIAAKRDDEYIERDVTAVDEADTYEEKEDKTMGAKDGCFDDVLICSAGCVWLALSYLDPPERAKDETTTRKTIVGEASMY